jgi:hypothetical protein
MAVQRNATAVTATSHVRTATLETTVASAKCSAHHRMMFHSSASWTANAMGTSQTIRRKEIELTFSLSIRSSGAA